MNLCDYQQKKTRNCYLFILVSRNRIDQQFKRRIKNLVSNEKSHSFQLSRVNLRHSRRSSSSPAVFSRCKRNSDSGPFWAGFEVGSVRSLGVSAVSSALDWMKTSLEVSRGAFDVDLDPVKSSEWAFVSDRKRSSKFWEELFWSLSWFKSSSATREAAVEIGWKLPVELQHVVDLFDIPSARIILIPSVNSRSTVPDTSHNIIVDSPPSLAQKIEGHPSRSRRYSISWQKAKSKECFYLHLKMKASFFRAG